MKKQLLIIAITFALCCGQVTAQKRLRDYGVVVGVMKTGANNAITDVKGVTVGQVTLTSDVMQTGVTAIVPHQGNLFKKKCPAAVYVGNGFGKLAGSTQVQELGNIETPIILTNTLNVAEGIAGAVEYTMKHNSNVRSVNALVGETNDGGLNDIRSRFVTKEHVIAAIESAKDGAVEEGCVGAGNGAVAFGYKAGIGTASRVLPASMGGYTVGVLVQANFGGVLQIAGVPVGQLLGKYAYRDKILQDVDGSCMIVVVTDAPVDARNLERMAKRAIMGMAQTGGVASSGSGDYAIAVSVAEQNLIDESTKNYTPTLLHNDDMSGLFMATIEATSEAIWNSLFAAEDVTSNGRTVKAIDKQKAIEFIKKAQTAVNLQPTYPLGQ
ncbi:MAG: P1 family peptidase [Muribaculaceae bacterium]|nr:P1 family peptidase [Muribaculaceae bacterium]